MDTRDVEKAKWNLITSVPVVGTVTRILEYQVACIYMDSSDSVAGDDVFGVWFYCLYYRQVLDYVILVTPRVTMSTDLTQNK